MHRAKGDRFVRASELPVCDNVENRFIKLYCVWSNMVTLNKAHATILVCAADDFRKYQKMQKLRF